MARWMGPDLQSRPGLDEREELGCGRWWEEMFDDEGTEISLDMCRRDVWSKTGQKYRPEARSGRAWSGEYVTDRPIRQEFSPLKVIPDRLLTLRHGGVASGGMPGRTTQESVPTGSSKWP